jgi:hypothetical protein
MLESKRSSSAVTLGRHLFLSKILVAVAQEVRLAVTVTATA